LIFLQNKLANNTAILKSSKKLCWNKDWISNFRHISQNVEDRTFRHILSVIATCKIKILLATVA